MNNLQTAQLLSKILCNMYVLAAKTQGFHWNVRGQTFFQLHSAFGDQYGALTAAIDRVAERIRALEQTPPSTLKQFITGASIKEQDAVPSANAMVKELLDDHAKCGAALAQVIKALADDAVSQNMVIDFKDFHDKTAWMLRSYLESAAK